MRTPQVRSAGCRQARRGRTGPVRDAGSGTLELVLTIPVLILMLAFLNYSGRMSGARLQIEDAAHQAARAASVSRSPSAAATNARSTAEVALSEAGVTCRPVTVAIRGTLQPGSTASATVSCTVELHDLALIHVPGTTTLTAHFAAPVDLHRGITNTAGG
ncbi:TadE/TadG family type IV pilus assembly protein [Streptomyces aurantiacus]|uniref:TadE/TadG family type IV pilus assembly protein n=1 Tax=Streptomyces aurantiacus TaxID=47760 RepID=UPI0016854551|nr:TadE/TadG family type IV pilus assembly protein [Streptomyces aurantiacus]